MVKVTASQNAIGRNQRIQFYWLTAEKLKKLVGKSEINRFTEEYLGIFRTSFSTKIISS